MHVSDVVRSIIHFFDIDFNNDIVNLGGESPLSIKTLIKKISKLCLYEGSIEWDLSKAEGSLKRYMNSDKIKKEYDFKIKINIDDGIKQTINWYKDKFL